MKKKTFFIHGHQRLQIKVKVGWQKTRCPPKFRPEGTFQFLLRSLLY